MPSFGLSYAVHSVMSNDVYNNMIYKLNSSSLNFFRNLSMVYTSSWVKQELKTHHDLSKRKIEKCCNLHNNAVSLPHRNFFEIHI